MTKSGDIDKPVKPPVGCLRLELDIHLKKGEGVKCLKTDDHKQALVLLAKKAVEESGRIITKARLSIDGSENGLTDFKSHVEYTGDETAIRSIIMTAFCLASSGEIASYLRIFDDEDPIADLGISKIEGSENDWNFKFSRFLQS